MNTNAETKKIILTDFVERLKKNYYRSANPLGIVSLSDDEDIEDLAKIIPSVGFLEINTESSETIDLIGKFAKEVVSRQITFVKIKTTIPENIYRQLNLISKERVIDVYDSVSNTWKSEPLPKNNVIILCGDRSILENQHGNLYNLASEFVDIN